MINIYNKSIKKAKYKKYNINNNEERYKMQNAKYKMKKTIYKIETTISIVNWDIMSFLYLFFFSILVSFSLFGNF